MTDRAPYSRIYHSIVDDPKFEHVYDDDRRLATWLRLLVVAEQAHPASAYIPAGTNRAALMALVDAKLVDLGTGSRFRIHGLDAERTRRGDAARVGGLASGRSRSVERPLNERGTETNLAKTSNRQDETSNTRARKEEGPRRAEFRDPVLIAQREAILAKYGEDQPIVPAAVKIPTAAEAEREIRRVAALDLHKRFLEGEIDQASYERRLLDVGKNDDDLTRLPA